MNARALVGSGVLLFATMFPLCAHAARCSDGSLALRSLADRSHVQHEQVDVLDDDCIERNIFFMPGVFGAYFQPSAGLGAFYGAGVQVAPYQWSHNNDNFGPSQGSVILQAALLRSQRSEGTLAIFEAGATASFERNSSRRWLIPYFGGAAGALTQSELGTSAYVYPFGGIHLYWHRNLMIDAEGGYHFPFTEIDRANGPRAQLAARMSMW